MSLAPGTRLGSHEIVGLLGAGPSTFGKLRVALSYVEGRLA